MSGQLSAAASIASSAVTSSLAMHTDMTQVNRRSQEAFISFPQDEIRQPITAMLKKNPCIKKAKWVSNQVL